MLSQEQIKKLESWITVSEMICESYNELINAELMYGRDSREYQRALRDIRIKLNTEKEVSQEFFENPILYDDIIFCLENCCRMQNGAFRIERRLDKNFSLKYEAFLNSFVGKAGVDEYSLSKDTCHAFKEMKTEILIKILYRLLGERKIVSLIDKKVGLEKDEKVRNMLITFKNSIISQSEDLEQWYFGIGNYVDSYLVDDDEIVARFLEISVEDYISRKNSAIKEYVVGIERISEEKDDSEIEKVRNSLPVILRPFLSLLPSSEIESLYQEFSERHRYGFSNLSVGVIEKAYVDALEDSREDEKIRRLIPGNL